MVKGTYYEVSCYESFVQSSVSSTSQILSIASLCVCIYGRTPLIQINWDGESSGYAENPDNWIFLGK